MNIKMALGGAALAFLASTGCAPVQAEPEPAIACTDYGFEPGTDAHASCVQEEVANRRLVRSIPPPPNPAMEAFRATLQPPPMQPPTTCIRNGNLKPASYTCY